MMNCNPCQQAQEFEVEESAYNPAPASEAGLDDWWCRWIIWIVHTLGELRTKISKAFHVVKAIGDDTREGGCHGTNEVEDGIPLLQFEAGIPAGEQVRTA
jgi:hypothetical protein